MLDLKKVREHLEEYKKVLQKRHSDLDIDQILSLDDKRKELQQKIDNLKFQQKELAAKQDYEGAKSLKSQIQTAEEEYNQVTEELKGYQLQMPNFLHDSIPEGKDDSENVEIRRNGEIPQFDFPLQDHMTLMKKYDMIDVERGVKLA
ncbi:hypothetical protein IJM86_06805 [bacterium]|nr:hypothetical protein [bacterium]